MRDRLRIVQWTTGNVAREAVRAVIARDDMELVGAFAHSAAKVGRDVAELVGLAEPTGIVATDDVDALLALHPDCVVYTPLHIDVGELVLLLRAGVNVVTSSEFMTGGSLPAADRTALAEAAEVGGASIFGSGMNPGFAQLLAAVASGISRDVRHVKLVESVDVSLFASDANMDHLGWGRPAGDPGHPAAVRAATLVFAEGLEACAAILGIEAPVVRCTPTFAHATHDLDLPGRPIAAGTVAGIDLRWEALVADHPVVELHQRWIMTRDLDEPWEVEHGYVVEVTGDPRIRVKLDIWPTDDDLRALTPATIHGIGMRITAVPIVDAIPAVCAALPGIRTYADLPVVAARLASRERGPA
jgi:hypothetical protein